MNVFISNEGENIQVRFVSLCFGRVTYVLFFEKQTDVLNSSYWKNIREKHDFESIFFAALPFFLVIFHR